MEIIEFGIVGMLLVSNESCYTSVHACLWYDVLILIWYQMSIFFSFPRKKVQFSWRMPVICTRWNLKWSMPWKVTAWSSILWLTLMVIFSRGWGWVEMFSRLRFRLREMLFNLFLYLVDAGKLADWNFDLHDLQLCFGVKEFLVWFNILSCLALEFEF